jgi:hypothetical protein
MVEMDASCGMFGRSPDFMNIFVTAFASAADELGRKDKRFAENLRYSGDPVRLAGTLYGLYDKDTRIERISSLLDDLEARRDAGGPALTFHLPE